MVLVGGMKPVVKPLGAFSILPPSHLKSQTLSCTILHRNELCLAFGWNPEKGMRGGNLCCQVLTPLWSRKIHIDLLRSVPAQMRAQVQRDPESQQWLKAPNASQTLLTWQTLSPWGNPAVDLKATEFSSDPFLPHWSPGLQDWAACIFKTNCAKSNTQKVT